MQRVIKATGMVALALGVVCFQGRQTCAAEAAPGKQIAQQFIFNSLRINSLRTLLFTRCKFH